MIAVLFEANAVPAQQGRYLQLAAQLQPELQDVEGFISIERFQRAGVEGKILSLSWWDSEDAVMAWKNNLKHQHAQREGQECIFSCYRIRVVQLLREYSSHPRGGSDV